MSWDSSGGLAGGDDGEVGGAVGGGDDAGVEVLAGVEVFDGGGLGEAEALGCRAGGFGVGREGGDAGGSGEEGGAEVRDGVADGSDAAQAGDDDTIQCCSRCVVWIDCRGYPHSLLPGRKSLGFMGLRSKTACKIFITNGLCPN